MTLQGTVVNGTIVLDQPQPLPEGTRVQVVVAKPPVQPKLSGLLKYAGALPDLPADFAAQHDHYIHGVPRR